MKCFNHPDREAVATCQNCGKGLCRECAEKHTPCLCDPCAAKLKQDAQKREQSKEEQRKQKYKDALVDSRSEFIKTAVIGVIVGVLLTWWLSTTSSSDMNGFGDYMGVFILFFFIPFGWKFLTYLQSFFPLSIIGTFWFWFIYIIVKALLSIFVGIPAFIYQLVKTILTQRKINKLK
ncbi:MAG: DUF6040 family protein [Firmicutes bacterium]|nr:DUF6040 family protein [Bacillota bacterium]